MNWASSSGSDYAIVNTILATRSLFRVFFLQRLPLLALTVTINDVDEDGHPCCRERSSLRFLTNSIPTIPASKHLKMDFLSTTPSIFGCYHQTALLRSPHVLTISRREVFLSLCFPINDINGYLTILEFCQDCKLTMWRATLASEQFLFHLPQRRLLCWSLNGIGIPALQHLCLLHILSSLQMLYAYLAMRIGRFFR